MVTLQARCPECAEVVTMTPPQTTLSWEDLGPPRRVVFTCPNCWCRVTLPINEAIAEQLVQHGAALPEVHRTPPGPPFDLDDLLDLHELLERDDWFAQLLASVR